MKVLTTLLAKSREPLSKASDLRILLAVGSLVHGLVVVAYDAWLSSLGLRALNPETKTP